MGAHRTNPVAIANAQPRQVTQPMQAMDLGEEVALIGVMLRPVIDTVTNELVIRLEMVGGHNSPILGGLMPREVPVGELVRLPLAKVRAVLKGAPPPAVEAPVGLATAETGDSPVDAPADGGPRLILGGRR